MTNTAHAVIAVLGLSTASAFAAESNVTMTSSMSADALWKKVGDFCGVAAWSPAIVKCVLSADGKQRTLSLRSGGTSVQALENWDDANRSYSYTNLSGPLPIANYHATLSVTGDPKGSVLKWMSSYDVKDTMMGVDVKKLIDDFYEVSAKVLTAD
jgi:Polyketide cyclase / dehydrase and lipid transport